MHRTETDSLGSVQVPADALWGAQTQRAIENFPVSGVRFPRAFLESLAWVKKACARANAEVGTLDPGLAGAIEAAAQEVADGSWDAHFPLDVFQTGSGTSTNMNANEVIANLANRRLGGMLGSRSPVHPNDHVNLGQSSNDVIPSVAHLATLRALESRFLPALDRLRASLARKAVEFDPVVKLGRTHLMDAMPVRLGQVFGGYARQLEKAGQRMRASAQGLRELALGGTAVGTGINTHPEFARRACARLAEWTGLPVCEALDHFEAQGARDDLAAVSAAVKTVAGSLTKIANDVRWMGSGPLGGLGELRLPDLQPGSSIMPGKVNPVLCEVLRQVAAQATGNDVAVTLGAQGGEFELNVMVPVIARNVLESVEILAAGMDLFARRCVDALEADPDRCVELAEQSPALVTVLNPIVGYDRAAQLAHDARRLRRGIRELAVEQGLLTAEEAARVFDLRGMTGGASGGV